MEINNFNQISSILSPLEKGDFYWIQVLKRRKENPDLHKNSIVIRSYYVDFGHSLNEIEQSVIKTCQENNARAYIALHKRNWRRIKLRMQCELARQFDEKLDFNPAYNMIDSLCGSYSSDSRSLRIIDVDSNDEQELYKTIEILNNIDKSIYLDTIPTVSGYHIIVKGFNTSLYNHKWTLQKKDKDKTLLYYNNEETKSSE